MYYIINNVHESSGEEPQKSNIDEISLLSKYQYNTINNRKSHILHTPRNSHLRRIQCRSVFLRESLFRPFP